MDYEKQNDSDWDASKGLRVMGLAYVSNFEEASFACIVSPTGECTDYKKFPNLLRRKDSYREDVRVAKVSKIILSWCELNSLLVFEVDVVVQRNSF